MNQIVSIRPAVQHDFEELYRAMTTNTKWKAFDGPYFNVATPSESEFREGLFARLEIGKSAQVIVLNGSLVGTVSCYWECQPTRWLEAGLCIYDDALWGCGVGTQALRLWISFIFEQFTIARLGMTTWSGNEGMMSLAVKMGLTLEGQLRKVRYHQGIYYDSMKYGVLREEWHQLELARCQA